MIPQRNKGHNVFWVQFAHGTLTLAHNIPLLKRAVILTSSARLHGDRNSTQPILSKLDYTRDIGGFFYGGKDWRAKHKELGKKLTENFFSVFGDNGNSMDTCFQYVAKDVDQEFDIRIKFYNKIV